MRIVPIVCCSISLVSLSVCVYSICSIILCTDAVVVLFVSHSAATVCAECVAA